MTLPSPPVITIDGPAGAGKSTAARELARRLGFRFLDTGAMYRAVALAGHRAKLDLSDSAALASLAARLNIQLRADQVFLDGEDVTRAIRTSEITALTRYAAGNPGVRERLVELQRAAAAESGVAGWVTEGRDQGTVVFPQAECKIFLTADPEERARRRQHDLAARGEAAPFDEVLRQQTERDQGDRTRTVGPLTPATDAIEFPTDGLSQSEVANRLEDIVRNHLHKAGS